MYNLSGLTLDLTNVYGSVPTHSDAIYSGGDYLSYYDTDIDGYLPHICENCNWNYSWVILGLNIYQPLQPYVSKLEQQLEMILIASYEIWECLVIPCCLLIVAILVYYNIYNKKLGIKFDDYMNDKKLDESFNNNARNLLYNRAEFFRSIGDEQDFVKISYQFHKIMIIAQKFLFALLLLSFILMIVYYFGNNWTQNGYKSLKISVTYLGSHQHNTSGLSVT